MKQIVVFFDGVCGLCNLSIDFLIRHDHQRKFLYSPLQGVEIQKYPVQVNVDFPEALLVWDGARMLTKTEAWFFLMSELGGWKSFLIFPLRVFPYTILDIFYDFLARIRYKIFGKRSVCRIPTSEERSLFLD